MLVVCNTCEKEFKRKPSQVKDKNYCSIKCNAKSLVKGSYTLCRTCGVSVWKTPKEMKDSKTGNLFCSHSCSAKFSNTKRSNNIYTYRTVAFEAHGKICNICKYDKIPEVLQVHHIDRNRRNSSANNLQVLCPTCHSIEHFNSKDGSFWNLQNNED